MTCIRRNLNTQNCCNQWQKGIRTIDGQYPDDNREFKITAGAGILITPITAGILITNTTDPAALEAGSNIELTPNGDHLQIGVVDGPTFEDDTTINGDLNVNGNIYNQGASYESHMEQVYTTNDYIIMRDNAVTGLAAGSYAGFQVKKYDGTNDGRLVIDNSGTARVGDVGDEQPLLTRDEAADLTNGNLLEWDGVNQKAIDGSIRSSSPATGVTVLQYGKIVQVRIYDVALTTGYNLIASGLPKAISFVNNVVCDNHTQIIGYMQINENDTKLIGYITTAATNAYSSITYITN